VKQNTQAILHGTLSHNTRIKGKSNSKRKVIDNGLKQARNSRKEPYTHKNFDTEISITYNMYINHESV